VNAGRRRADSSRLLQWFARLPEHPAKQRILRRWIGRLMPRSGLVFEVDRGVRLWLHPTDWIEYLLMTTGVYEPHTLRFLESNLAEGDATVLAGVNFGLHLIVAARRVGRVGSAIGVDPQPGSVERALQNAALNGIGEQLKVAAMALDRHSGTVWLDLPPEENSGAASILAGGPDKVMAGSLRFDELVAKCGLSRVRLFLLDVEGYELNVLRGLGAVRPEIIVVESHAPSQRRAGHTQAELMRELESLGYRLTDLHGNPHVDPEAAVTELNVVARLPGIVPVWVSESFRPVEHSTHT
jgi:FkbM family methyltransferase